MGQFSNGLLVPCVNGLLEFVTSLLFAEKEDDIGSVEFPVLEKEDSKEKIPPVRNRRARTGFSDSFSDFGKLPFFFPSCCF